jgi:hypothetical protein
MKALSRLLKVLSILSLTLSILVVNALRNEQIWP